MAVDILVCVKVVPRASVPLRLDPGTLRLDRSGPTEINPSDTFAVEEALLLRERVGGTVTVLAMAPEAGRESLRGALAMGVDRAICISDPQIEGSDLLGTARVLSAAIASHQPDVVIFGAQAIDGRGSATPAAVAERIRQPLVSGVRTVDVVDGRLRGGRQEVTHEQVLEAPLPCMVALAGSTNVPRFPSFRDIVAAKKKEIETRTLADLGVAAAEAGIAAARTSVLALAAPPARQASGEVIEDDGNGAAWLEAFITSRGLA
jgi:electron transfer flavoprotein beta subunit